MQVLTVEDKILHNFAIIDPLRKKIIWTSGDLFKLWIPELLRRPIRLREEIFDEEKKQRVVYLRGIAENDPNFPKAMREEFERNGLHAELIGASGARLQMILRHSSLSRGIQNRIVYNLRRLTDPQITDIVKELRAGI